MNRSTLQQSTSLYREIFSRIRSETSWELDQDFGMPEEAITAVADGERTTGEIFYSCPDTEARVSVSFPVYETEDAMKLLLDNPLDRQLTHSQEGFVGQLCRTQQEIARNHRTEYIEPIADPSLIARALVPIEYDEETLSETLRELKKIAVETEGLHEELRTVLEAWSENQPATSDDSM